MNNFQYARATDVTDAIRLLAADPGAKLIAGGTNLIDLMKENVERPSRLIDISRLPLRKVEETADGSLRIGALVPNSDLAYHPLIEQRYPLLASAILAGASAQLRNMASVGGNLMQRTRCAYFYDTATPCNKRRPSSGCSAMDGLNRNHAILGTSASCIATNPSDMSVALAALGALVHIAGRSGERTIALTDFHRLPGDTPHVDTNLGTSEIITAIEIPACGFAQNYSYLKVRDRMSYAFALVLGRRRARTGRQRDQRGTDGARRRGSQALAQPRSRSGVARPGRDARSFLARRGSLAPGSYDPLT
ncbi:xanthine dehydrogenase YagS FAD-binding subunit [Bradyrhizobium sp. LM6.9]